MRKADKITLAGLSLGGIITSGYAGFIGEFDSYISFAGGSGIPLFIDRIIKRHDIIFAIANEFKKAGWTFKDSVESFLIWDPILWANDTDPKSSFLMINACNDEFLDPESTVLPFQKLYRKAGGKLISRWNHLKHNPSDASVWELITQILLPIQRWGEDKKVAQKQFIHSCLGR